MKIGAEIVVLTIIGTVLASIGTFHKIYWPLFPIPILFGLLISLTVWFIIKPVAELRQAAKLYAKGELLHRININTGDEIEDIATDFNKMAESLDQTLKNYQQSSNQISLEAAKMNIILASIVDGIIVLDIHKNVILTNKAAEKLTGYTDAEMKQKNIDTLITITNQEDLLVHSKDYAPVEMDPNQPIAPFVSNMVFTLTGKGGAKIPISLTGAPIKGNLQSDLGTVLALHGLSKEKQLESIQLDFVSMASHELRTPLTSIIGYMSVFLEENESKLNQQQKDFLNRILISARQLGNLIGNLLSVSKIERNALTSTMQPMDWTTALKQSVDQNKVSASQKNINLRLELPQNPLPQVKADSVRIAEVVNNLISNAINYTPNGGSILVKAQDIGSEVVTSVADTGIGIQPDALPHLFTKFFRVGSALDLASNSKGTGLGLYLSKSIIDLHHGRIWATSTPGHGSTFFFTLPVATQAQSVSPSPTQNTFPPLPHLG